MGVLEFKAGTLPCAAHADAPLGLRFSICSPVSIIGVPLSAMPDNIIKRLPRYPSVPVAKLGRLAIDVSFQGQKLGAALLWDAVIRSLRSEVAVFALVVDAKDDLAESFYKHHGFQVFGEIPRQLILPLMNLKT